MKDRFAITFLSIRALKSNRNFQFSYSLFIALVLLYFVNTAVLASQANSDAQKALDLPAETQNDVDALLMFKIGEYKQVIDECAKALTLNPHDARALTLRAQSEIKLAQYSSAVEDCTKVIELYPKDALAYSIRGLGYLKLKQYQNTIDDTTQAIKLNPIDAAAYANRSLAFQSIGQVAESDNDRQKALELNPELANRFQTI